MILVTVWVLIGVGWTLIAGGIATKRAAVCYVGGAVNFVAFVLAVVNILEKSGGSSTVRLSCELINGTYYCA